MLGEDFDKLVERRSEEDELLRSLGLIPNLTVDKKNVTPGEDGEKRGTRMSKRVVWAMLPDSEPSQKQIEQMVKDYKEQKICNGKQ